MRGEIADRKSGDDQLAGLAVDVTETCRRRDDALEAAGDHRVECHGENVGAGA